MDILDGLRLGEDQEVVITLLVAGAAEKTVAAEMILIKPQSLDLRAHGAVENENAFARGLGQRLENFPAVALRTFGTEEMIEHGRFPPA